MTICDRCGNPAIHKIIKIDAVMVAVADPKYVEPPSETLFIPAAPLPHADICGDCLRQLQTVVKRFLNEPLPKEARKV